MMLCSLVDVHQYSRGTRNLHLQGRRDTLNMEAAGSSKILVPAAILVGVTSQKTIIFIVTALKTSV
jgi:hypothetical protein